MKLSPRELNNQALRLAKLKRNSPNPFEDAARGRDPAPKSSGDAPKERKANPGQATDNRRPSLKDTAGLAMPTSPETGRTLMNLSPEAKSKRGRPPKSETENVSRATLWRRRKAEEKTRE